MTTTEAPTTPDDVTMYQRHLYLYETAKREQRWDDSQTHANLASGYGARLTVRVATQARAEVLSGDYQPDASMNNAEQRLRVYNDSIRNTKCERRALAVAAKAHAVIVRMTVEAEGDEPQPIVERTVTLEGPYQDRRRWIHRQVAEACGCTTGYWKGDGVVRWYGTEANVRAGMALAEALDAAGREHSMIYTPPHGVVRFRRQWWRNYRKNLEFTFDEVVRRVTGDPLTMFRHRVRVQGLLRRGHLRTEEEAP